MWNWSTLSILGLLLLPLTVAAQGLTPASAHLEAAIGYYTDLEYERALVELSRAQRRAESEEEMVPTLLYQGIIHSELNQGEEAAAAFQAALQIQPSAALPMRVAPKIARHFEAQREQLQQHATRTKPAAELGASYGSDSYGAMSRRMTCRARPGSAIRAAC
jgi:tetratricopeptide (TPR) repeat protein